MSRIIELSDESAALLQRQAAAHGLSIEAWIKMLADEKARANADEFGQQKAHAALTRILNIQKRVKPDPEGWTVRDYIDHGRR